MIADSLLNLRDFLHAQMCYQLFKTPIPYPLGKEYRELARKACEYLRTERSEMLEFTAPRHYVIHHFAAADPQAKKILIAHGWMSRAAYMARLIRALHQQGFDVYALDFPAHGEAKGLQLPWMDAVGVIKQVLNELAPFYAVVGHSFGGSMVLNALNLAGQYPEWHIASEPERVVLMASPTRMRTPVGQLARYLGLNAKSYLLVRQFFSQHTQVDLKHLAVRYYNSRTNPCFLCIHGEDDYAIPAQESILFCEQYPNASLALLAGINHQNILMDERVEKMICRFLS